MSTTAASNLQEVLTAHGYRMTRARTALFDALLSSGPLSMRELLERTSGSTDRVSLYRNVEVFEKLHIVHRIPVGWKYKIELTDLFIPHHHHMKCLNCGKIIEIDEGRLEGFIEGLAKDFEFKVTGHHFEVEGWCEECKS